MVAAAVMLGLGIGLTTAMFTVVDALILRPVPFRDRPLTSRLHDEPLELCACLRRWS